MVFVRFPFERKAKCVFQEDPVVDTSKIQSYISSYLGADDFRVYCNGKELVGDQEVFRDATVYVSFSLPGGKGGFGSMLRAIGAQIEKTTNREACRDLSGRRLRDINEEQRLKKWIAKESEREEDKLRRRKERIERLKAKPKHNFVDFEYEKVISQLPERIDDALSAGMQKVAKRPIEEGESSKTSQTKKKCLWLDEDLSESSASDSESSEKTNSSKDTDCSNTNVEIKTMSPNLVMEISAGESSNSSTDFKQSSNAALNPDVQELPSSEAKEVAVIETPATSPPLQEDMSCSVTTKEVSTEETENKDVFTSVPLQEDEPSSVTTKEVSSKETENKDVFNSVPHQEDEPCSVTTMEVSTEETENKDAFTSVPLQEDKPCSVTTKEVSTKETENKEDELPIDLLSFNSQAEFEALGLNRLKAALMSRGLKCGGNISDRALRLWKVRGLQPEEYPANLRVKSKK